MCPSAVGLVGIAFYMFMFVPRSQLLKFYALTLALLAFAGVLVLSHAGLRDQLDAFFVSAYERCLSPVALLLGVIFLTHSFADNVCGVKPKALWPLFLVPVPLSFYKLGVVSSPAQSSWAWLLEYGFYLVSCALLLQAFGLGIEHLTNSAEPRDWREQPVTDEEVKTHCNECISGSAFFGGLLLALGGGIGCSRRPSQILPESQVSSTGHVIFNSPTCHVKQDFELLGVSTEHDNVSDCVPKAAILSELPGEIPLSRWQEQVAYSVALSFQSPVSIFAFECIFAFAVYLVLTCLDRVFWLLEQCGGEGEHSDTLREELNIRDVFSASFIIKFCFLFYVFVNHSLLSLPTAERSARLLYLPAWLSSHAALVVVQLLSARLRIAAIRSERCLSPHSLVCAALLLSLAALCCWLVPLTWPAAELPLWHRFWRTLLTLQLSHLMLASLLSLASGAAMRLLPTRFLQIQTLLECVRVAISTVLMILELRLYLQSLFAGEWNILTLVLLFGTSIASIGGVFVFLQNLLYLPQALRPQQLNTEGDADFVARVRASAAEEHQQEKCSICREPFTEAAIAEVARTPCRHYFHARCLAAWFLSQPNRSCPLCRQQIDAVSPLERVRRAGLDANVQNLVALANFHQGIQQGFPAAFNAAAQPV